MRIFARFASLLLQARGFSNYHAFSCPFVQFVGAFKDRNTNGRVSMARFVAYYRVSTERQERSGLGLAAQNRKIDEFLAANDELVGEFCDVQSGRDDFRLELQRAIQLAKRENAKILIARLDRFSRRVSFIANILEQGIGLVCAEMPNATDFQLYIFAALAQEERRLISERTRAALAEAKRRGTILGANGKNLAAKNRKAADEFAATLRAKLDADLIGRSYRRSRDI
jgi:DNA invertase Pin-like site-specific DNA recombinase